MKTNLKNDEYASFIQQKYDMIYDLASNVDRKGIKSFKR